MTDQTILQQNKTNPWDGSLQVGHDALGDFLDAGMVGLLVYLGAVGRDVVAHRIQIRLREVGLHQPHGVLYGVPGCSLDEGLQSATGRLQPFRQYFRRGHALRLERPQQSVQLTTEVL